MVQLEAMARGTPIVLSRINSGVLGVGEEGKTTTYIEPQNPKSIADKVNHLLENPDKIDEMSDYCLEYFEKKFTNSVLLPQYEEFYEKSLES